MYVYTLGFIFSNHVLFNPEEWFGVSVFLFMLLFLITPVPEEYVRHPLAERSILVLIQDAWFGEMALWLAFWPWFLVLNLIWLTGDSLVKNAVLSVSSWDSLMLMTVPPTILWWTAVWRTSANTGHRLFGTLARLFTLAVLSDYVFRVILRIDFPRGFFNCEGMLLNYTSCF